MSTIHIALIFVPEKIQPLRVGRPSKPYLLQKAIKYGSCRTLHQRNAHKLIFNFFLLLSWAKIIFLVLERNIVTDTFFNDDLALYMTKSWGVQMGVSKVCHVFE